MVELTLDKHPSQSITNSYLYRLDARAKIILVLVAMIFGFLSHSFIFQSIIIVACFVSLIASGQNFSSIKRALSVIIVIVPLTFIYHLLFSGNTSGERLTVFGIELSKESLVLASFYTVRLIQFITLTLFLLSTSSPVDLTEGVVKFLRPLQRLGVPINDFGLILYISLRFIPIMHEEFQTIRNAQMLRGVIFTGSLFHRIGMTSHLLLPVLMTAVDRADALADALYARGYRSDKPRTLYTYSRFGKQESALTIAGVVGITVFYMVILL
ncbi:MAG: energy-coupling factor transporter transmembrane component T [candidate division Zixibacteria bacterium]|nr:energy-coupling factor transporter transmembrane component T [candidate division Zixibacteria bacterium]